MGTRKSPFRPFLCGRAKKKGGTDPWKAGRKERANGVGPRYGVVGISDEMGPEQAKAPADGPSPRRVSLFEAGILSQERKIPEFTLIIAVY